MLGREDNDQEEHAWLVSTTARAPPREALLRCVTANPAVHLRELARQCNLTLGTTFHHLTALEQQGLLEVRQDGRCKRFFAPGQLTPAEQGLAVALRAKSRRQVLLHLLHSPAATQRDIMAATGLTRSVIAPALRMLVDNGIVTTDRIHGEYHYTLVHREPTARLLERFRDSFDEPAPTEQPTRVTPLTAPRLDLAWGSRAVNANLLDEP